MFCSWLCFGIVRFIHVSNASPEVREKRKISRDTRRIFLPDHRWSAVTSYRTLRIKIIERIRGVDMEQERQLRISTFTTSLYEVVRTRIA